MLSPIWTNCWPQTKTTCGTTIHKHCSRDRDNRDYDHWLRIGKGAAAGTARPERPENAPASTPPRSESEQSTREMEHDASRRSTNISKECRALDANGTGRAE